MNTRIESYCPKCGEPLVRLLSQLNDPPKGVGIACPGCLEGLVTTRLPFAERLNPITASSQTMNQSRQVYDAIVRSRNGV